MVLQDSVSTTTTQLMEGFTKSDKAHSDSIQQLTTRISILEAQSSRPVCVG